MRKRDHEPVVLEAASRRSRPGRPRVFSKEELDPSVGPRQSQDRAYARLAEQHMGLAPGEMPISVGAQLGRFQNPTSFKQAMNWWSTDGQYLPAKVAAIRLRHMRIGRVAQPSSPYVALDRAAFEYLAGHPRDHDLLLFALDVLKEAVQRDRGLR